MRKTSWLAVLALGVGVLNAMGAEMVGVRGSSAQYATALEANVNGKAVPLTLTGAALRTRLIVNVYAVGSYVQSGAGVKADTLAAADVVKRLHIVMERDVSGTDMAAAFRSAIRANYPEPAFNTEVSTLVEQMQAMNLKKGDTVYLTHVPGAGLTADVAGKATFSIKSPTFSKAVWDIYLGKRNLGDDIKTNLTNRL